MSALSASSRRGEAAREDSARRLPLARQVDAASPQGRIGSGSSLARAIADRAFDAIGQGGLGNFTTPQSTDSRSCRGRRDVGFRVLYLRAGFIVILTSLLRMSYFSLSSSNYTLLALLLFSSNIQIRVRRVPRCAHTPLGSSRSRPRVVGALRALRPTPRPRVCVCSLARIHLFIHTYIRALRSCTTRCPSGLALASLSPTFIISSISTVRSANYTSLPPLLRSPVTLRGSSRLSRVPSRAGVTTLSRLADAQTGTMLPSPRLSQGPRLARRRRHGVNGGRGGSADASPAPEDLSNRAPSSAATRGRYGVLLRPTQQALVHMQFWFGGSEGWSFASDLQRLRLVSSRRWALRFPHVSVRRHATAAKRTVVFAARRADLREAGRRRWSRRATSAQSRARRPNTSPTGRRSGWPPMRARRRLRGGRREQRAAGDGGGDRGDLAAATACAVARAGRYAARAVFGEGSPKMESESSSDMGEVQRGPLGPASGGEGPALAAQLARTGQQAPRSRAPRVAAPRCEARCRRALRRRRWRRRQGRCRWASSCAWVRRHRSRRQRADGAARGRPCTPVARRAAPHSR